MSVQKKVPAYRFTGVFIPAEILEMESLSMLDIILLSMVDALCSEEMGGCFASNEYLAMKLRVSRDTISRSITHLRRLDLIEKISFNGRTRIIKTKRQNLNSKSEPKLDSTDSSNLNQEIHRSDSTDSSNLSRGIRRKGVPRPYYIYNKEDNKEIYPPLDPPPWGDTRCKAGSTHNLKNESNKPTNNLSHNSDEPQNNQSDNLCYVALLVNLNCKDTSLCLTFFRTI